MTLHVQEFLEACEALFFPQLFCMIYLWIYFTYMFYVYIFSCLYLNIYIYIYIYIICVFSVFQKLLKVPKEFLQRTGPDEKHQRR